MSHSASYCFSHTPAASQRHFLNCLVPGPRTSLQSPSMPPATLSDMDPSQLTCQGRMTNQRSNPGSASNSRGEKSRAPQAQAGPRTAEQP